MERKSVSPAEANLFHSIPPQPSHYPWPIVPKILLRSDVEVRRARLAEVVADLIVPRLQNLHNPVGARTPALAIPRAEEIGEFGAIVMGSDVAAASAYFNKMRGKGYSLDTLFVHFLEPTARYLGELWDQDLCDFVDVTIGVAHLQELLSIFGSGDDIPVRDADHRALLMTTPREKHLFGVEMVAKFMRGAGWDVTTAYGSSTHAVAQAKRQWFGVAGLTLSGEAGLDAAAQMIQAVRRESMNQTIRIMVGGPLFARKPELVAQIGADSAASDAPTAVVLAKKLVLGSPV
jgi:MerR family transcriptional regulator, light-induced transcriptional regulator